MKILDLHKWLPPQERNRPERTHMVHNLQLQLFASTRNLKVSGQSYSIYRYSQWHNIIKFAVHVISVESRDYAPVPPPPFVHASIGQKWGGGLYAGSLHFRVTTITDCRMPRGCDLCTCRNLMNMWDVVLFNCRVLATCFNQKSGSLRSRLRYL